MMKHLPVILVIVPLLVAPVCFLIRRAEIAWFIAVVVSVTGLATTIALIVVVGANGPISYELGGWAAPWGIAYKIDSLTVIVLLLITGTNFITSLYCRKTVEQDIDRERHGMFYAAWMLAVCGMLGIVVTGDIFNVFVFLEISSLSSYLLIAAGGNRLGLLAAFRYLIIGTVGATFFLIGVGLIYALTGTLNMEDIATRLQHVEASSTVAVAVGFLIVGIAIKMALFPLHNWMPDAYTYAPSAVSALLAGTMTKVSVYLLIRVVVDIFGYDRVMDQYGLAFVLATLAIVAILIGSLAACWQENAKRILAWSSVAQIGYMTLGIAIATKTGLIASILHMFNHALMKSALFMAVGCLIWRVQTASLNDLRGLGRSMPWTFGALTISSASLIGIPLTAGFVSKWYLVLAVIEKGWWPVVGIIVVSSVIAAVYLGRLIEILWFREPNSSAVRHEEVSWWLLGPTWAMALANVWFGMFTELPVNLAETAASMLARNPL